MDSTGEKLHPNWRALASVSFQRQNFVRASLESEAAKKAKDAEIAKARLEGSEVSAFYSEVISTESTKTIPRKARKRASVQDLDQGPGPSSLSYTISDAFFAAQSDKVEVLKSSLAANPEYLNQTDSYGWTLLMTACRAKSIEVIKVLVSKDADQNIADKAGNTCRSLCDNSKPILDILNKKTKSPLRSLRSSSKPKVKEIREFKCEECSVSDLTKSEYKSHLGSTTHQLKAGKAMGEKPKVHYGIPEANRGYQMMLKKNWESNAGLGPEGKKGKLYPVKTVLKQDRHGLGLEEDPQKKKAKVTHFSAFDKTSVKNPGASSLRTERATTLSKRQFERQKQKIRRKEVDFRREFM